jgi:DNA-binding transcriptional ArsR family regulator
MATKKHRSLSGAQLSVVSRLFGVLSEPSRLALLQALHDAPLSVTELVEACAMKQANVSKHLAVLHEHKLVRREREGTSIRYEVTDPMVFSLCDQVCGKLERDTRQAAALFHPEI